MDQLCCCCAGVEAPYTSMREALFVHLYLADMAHFPAANAVFAQHFAAVNPPARACVEARLSKSSPVAVDVLCPGTGQHPSALCQAALCTDKGTGRLLASAP